MNLRPGAVVRIALLALLTVGAVGAQSEQPIYGGADDVAFANELWIAMVNENVVGSNATEGELRIGIHPHGAILESSFHTITVRGLPSTLSAKLSYRGIGTTLNDVRADRAAYIEDVTVMFKREDGYDPAGQNWFWAKYNPDGSLDSTPNGVKLAGKIATGKPKGCIACHLKAQGGDMLFSR